jgi:hypothetical protein
MLRYSISNNSVYFIRVFVKYLTLCFNFLNLIQYRYINVNKFISKIDVSMY